jgi:S-adenosylmethionine/arginine decarboxylase-like enzyme
MKKHVMLDCYGANQFQLNDIKYINDTLNHLVYALKVNPICPPQLIPYYYGKVKDDLGISAFILLEGGHITIHTFPIRECYFVDIFYDGDFDEEIARTFLLKNLPFNEEMSFKNCLDRQKQDYQDIPYDSSCDFGPHLMTEINASGIITMERFFDFLETTVHEINMDPISRPYVLKSTPNKPKYLSAIIIIAQSHIALHYNYKTGIIYADIFSCAPFDFSNVRKIYHHLGEVTYNGLITRGTKHIYKVKSGVSKDDLKASMRWQKSIKK